MIESRIQADGLLSPSGAPSFGLILDTNSFVPYYQQIVDHVRELVEKRVLREGDGFFSEGEIARALGISKMPVRQAFQKLRAEGLLIVAKGKRPAIGSGRVPWNFQQLRGFSEEMRRRGLIPSARVLSMKVTEPELETAQALKLTLDEKVYALRRLRFVNAEPVAVVTSHLPVRIFTGIEKQDLEKQSLYQIFETQAPVGRGDDWSDDCSRAGCECAANKAGQPVADDSRDHVRRTEYSHRVQCVAAARGPLYRIGHLRPEGMSRRAQIQIT
jgi:GntR family transcriptional regulator